MMGELIGIADKIESNLRGFLTPFRRAIRGVFLDVDEYWESAQLHHRIGSPFLSRYGYLNHEELSLYRSMFQTELFFKDLGTDLDHFKPQWWDRHCQAMGYPPSANPVNIRVILKENSPVDKIEFPTNYEGHPIVYEYRPANRAIATPDLMDRLAEAVGWLKERRAERAPSIGRANPNTAGTLGGILVGTDARKKYLVTCAHVLGPAGTDVYQPGPFEGKHSKPIGTVNYFKIPVLGRSDDPCSEPAVPDATRLDLAVAELGVGADLLHGMGAITTVNDLRPIVAMRKNDRVTFTGKTRGRIDAKMGSLTLWDQVEFLDGVRCFGRIFEIKLPSRAYVREELAHPGDSGSWVVFQLGEIVTWYGMVISCDGGQAYACFAEYVLEECNRCGVFPGGLRLPA